MSRSDDAKPRSTLRNWWLTAFVLVIPLAWVGTQSMDEPLYATNASSRPLHASLIANASSGRSPTERHAHASMLSEVMRLHGAHDIRALFSSKGIYPHARYDTPMLSGAHGKGVNAMGKDASHAMLDSFGAQEYELAVTDAR